VRVVLDTGPLGRLCHPRTDEHLTRWVAGRYATDPSFVALVPEVVDYELRRGYLLKARYEADPIAREKFQESINTLEQVLSRFVVTPITLDVWRRAAQLWADIRRMGQRTAPDEALDIDVIVASCALLEGAPVLTMDTDFARFGVELVDIPQNGEEDQPTPG